MSLTFEEYQRRAISLAIYPGQGTMMGLVYTGLGLTGESGEVAEKIKKILRDDLGVITNEKRLEVAKELSDVAWYLAAMCHELNMTLAEVAQLNLDKLESRKQRGVLGGSGDNR